MAWTIIWFVISVGFMSYWAVMLKLDIQQESNLIASVVMLIVATVSAIAHGRELTQYEGVRRVKKEDDVCPHCKVILRRKRPHVCLGPY